MKILVFANDMAWYELTEGITGVQWIRAENIASFADSDDMAAYFNLSDDANETDHSSFKRPVFINSVVDTLKEIHAAGNVIRINGWNSFLKRTSWEVAGNLNDDFLAVFKAMNKTAIAVPDEPGFIAARIIAMIINEAYFAKEENVSSEKEIDIAMKLGTNYPYGPFEWADIIGIKNIHALLKNLSATDNRYKPSPLLEQAAMKNQ